MSLKKLLLSVSLIFSTLCGAQTPPATLSWDRSPTSATEGSTGYAIQMGERIIAVVDRKIDTKISKSGKKPSYALSRFGQHDGWQLELDKLMCPMNISYCPIIPNGIPVPVYPYNPSFTLADKEVMLIHSADGRTIQGTFRCEGYNTTGYSAVQGFRRLLVQMPKDFDIYNASAFVTVTKSDGRQVVGTRTSSTEFTDQVTKEKVRALAFEPLLIGHPSFQVTPQPKDGVVFGFKSSLLAAKELSRWICPELFELQAGMNVQALRKVYRVDASDRHFTIKGELRCAYNQASISCDGDKLESFTLGSGRFTESAPPPVDHLATLLGVFGEPAEAMKIIDAYKKETVLLRFKLNAGSDFVVKLSGKGPVNASVDKLRTLRDVAIRNNAKTTTPLATTPKELAAACQQLSP